MPTFSSTLSLIYTTEVKIWAEREAEAPGARVMPTARRASQASASWAETFIFICLDRNLSKMECTTIPTLLRRTYPPNEKRWMPFNLRYRVHVSHI